MAEENNAPIEETPEVGSSSKKQPLVAVLLIVNALVMGGVAYSQFSLQKKLASQPSVKDIVAAEMKLAGAASGGEKPAGGGHGEGGGHGGGDKVKLGGDNDKNLAAQGIMFPLDSFVANLAQGDGPRRYVRMNVVLKFALDSKEEEIKAKKPQIQDSIISILNSKRPEDLLKREGKNYLKEEIKSAVNSFLVDGQIVDIYYVGFQIN